MEIIGLIYCSVFSLCLWLKLFLREKSDKLNKWLKYVRLIKFKIKVMKIIIYFFEECCIIIKKLYMIYFFLKFGLFFKIVIIWF